MDTYYVLLDKDTGKVSKTWKALHLVMFTFIIILGFVTASLFGRGLKGFGNHCVLYSHIGFMEHIQNVTNSSTPEPPIPTKRYKNVLLKNLTPLDLSLTDWHTTPLCNFCQFMPLFSTISAIVWMSIFIVCSSGGAGYDTDAYSQPWRIVFPALIWSIIITVLMLIASIKLFSGLGAFCAEFKDVFSTSKCTSSIDEYTVYFNENKTNSIIKLYLSSIVSWICCFAWFLHTFILILRILCIPDFQMVQIIITSRMEAAEKNAAKAIKSSPSKSDRKSIYFNRLDKEKMIDDDIKLSSSKSGIGHRSPSINYVDDSPYLEGSKDLSLTSMREHVQANDNIIKETRFQAPHADLSSL